METWSAIASKVNWKKTRGTPSRVQRADDDCRSGKEKLDNFRQVLFAIGTDLYKQASPEVELSESHIADETILEEDNTVTADYEAIE